MVHKHVLLLQQLKSCPCVASCSKTPHAEVSTAAHCPQVRIRDFQRISKMNIVLKHANQHSLIFSVPLRDQGQCDLPPLCGGRTPYNSHGWQSVCGCGCDDGPEPHEPTAPVKHTDGAHWPPIPKTCCEKTADVHAYYQKMRICLFSQHSYQSKMLAFYNSTDTLNLHVLCSPIYKKVFQFQ